MPTITRCRIASDVDHLSKIQLEEVSQALKKHHPKLEVESVYADEAVGKSASGEDDAPDSPVRVAKLMSSLLDEAYDALVLNATHLPARLPTGLTIGAITGRLTPYDVMVSRDHLLDELPDNASLIANGEGREAQLLYYRPDLKIVRTKGSVDSLIQKVQSEKIDAVILAAGDVERLQKQDHVVEFLTCSICTPTAGQGCLAVLVRSNEEHAKKSIRAINEPASFGEVAAEWAFLDCLGVRGSAPVAVLGSMEGNKIELEGMIALPDGRERIHAAVTGGIGHEAEVGQKLATEILDSGGRALLQELDLL